MINCVFSGNTAGGSIAYPGAPPAPGYGGGLHAGPGYVLVLNSTFVGNRAGYAGGAISSENTTYAHCVAWGNWDDDGTGEKSQIYYHPSRPPVFRYNCIQGWTGEAPGVGNVDLDPLFVDADGPDNVPGTADDNFRLSPESPLINAADPDPPLVPRYDFDRHIRTLCGRVDMGAFEFGIGDYNCDREVTLIDFGLWPACTTGPGAGPYPLGCEAFDFNADRYVDLADFAGFVFSLTGP